ncbi:MAG: hypothetical protein JKY93_02055 [Gammaproteobacteria bacterium]|nr:hypothetical protein [Gammaproteobacteria bacterium]
MTLSETLSAISENTGLDFIVPDQQYSKIKVPMFYSMAGGYHCMDSLSRVFSIPQMIWQQQGDGSVYVGSWLHSFWADKQPSVPDKWHDNHGVVGSARVPAFPMLRPGSFVNGEKYLTEVHLDGVHMNIKWSEDPWKNPLRR